MNTLDQDNGCYVWYVLSPVPVSRRTHVFHAKVQKNCRLGGTSHTTTIDILWLPTRVANFTCFLGETYTSIPDTPSPVFPDRLIRPLPKRPIRSRLSAEAAGSILYPPAPPVARLFYGAYAGNGDAVNDAKVYVQQTDFGYEHSPESDFRHPYEDGVDSGDEDGPVVVRRSVGLNRSSSSPTGADHRQKYAKHVTPASNRSAGPDGYDAFENTNNKKKRKIPTSGSLGSHSGLSTELANLGLSGGGDANGVALDDGSGTGSYYGSGNPASPAGNGSARGRYPRSGSSRGQPSGAWAGVLPGKGRRDWVYRAQDSAGTCSFLPYLVECLDRAHC